MVGTPGRAAVAAVDHAARSLGLLRGMPIAQAQALVPGLTVLPAQPEGDARAFEELAAWCLRYAPLTARDRPNGVWIDAPGCAHLFGGAASMLADMVEHFGRSGIASRAAIADTPGAAWATARYVKAAVAVVPAGETAVALRPPPIAALRLNDDTIDGPTRLGFDRIEQLLDAPRAPLTLRSGREVIRRIDQALGRVSESIEPVAPPDTRVGSRSRPSRRSRGSAPTAFPRAMRRVSR